MGDKMMNKAHPGTCALSQRTYNTMGKAEDHELLQNEWDNEQV